MKNSFAVVGASCVDIFAASAKPLIEHDSNPGTVQIGFGGVGRNIAENLARLEQTVDLFAAFGSDVFSSQMREYTAASGVNTDGCLLSSEEKAPYYIAVNDSNGDMAVAVNDMSIADLMTPEYLTHKLDQINGHDAVIIDANLSKNTIEYLAANCTIPLFADAVSVSKAVKLLGALPRIFALNVNLNEAQSLLQQSMTADFHSLQHAANQFHELGVRYVLITLGARGAFISTARQQLMMNAFPTETKNANGCGDAFSAAAFLEIAFGNSLENILTNALAAASLTAQSGQSVAEGISPSAILATIEKVRNQQ